MEQYRRPVRHMSQRRRYAGLSPYELQKIYDIMGIFVQLIITAVAMQPSMLKDILLYIASVILIASKNASQYVHNDLDRVDPTNKNRLVDSFTEEECWNYFRFRKEQMRVLSNSLDIPVILICENGLSAPGEHALCLYLYLKMYPTKLH